MKPTEILRRVALEPVILLGTPKFSRKVARKLGAAQWERDWISAATHLAAAASARQMGDMRSVTFHWKRADVLYERGEQRRNQSRENPHKKGSP